MEIRKPLTDQLITDFTALKHSNDTDALFASVQKIYIKYPDALPACVIAPSSPSVEVAGLDFDQRILGFTAEVYELIEANDDGDISEAVRKLDRLSDIEDQVYNYLEQIPNPVERAVSGVHVTNIDIAPGNYIDIFTERGLERFLQINFDLSITISVKNT